MNPNDQNDQTPPQEVPVNPPKDREPETDNTNVTLPPIDNQPNVDEPSMNANPVAPTVAQPETLQQPSPETADNSTPQPEANDAQVEPVASVQPEMPSEQNTLEQSSEPPFTPEQPAESEAPTPNTPEVATQPVSQPPQAPQATNQESTAQQETVAGIPTSNSPSKGLAVASLVLGIIGMLTGWLLGLGIVLGIAAIVLGAIVLMKHKAGKGLAIAGITTGALAVLGGLFLLTVTLTAFSFV